MPKPTDGLPALTFTRDELATLWIVIVAKISQFRRMLGNISSAGPAENRALIQRELAVLGALKKKVKRAALAAARHRRSDGGATQ